MAALLTCWLFPGYSPYREACIKINAMPSCDTYLPLQMSGFLGRQSKYRINPYKEEKIQPPKERSR